MKNKSKNVKRLTTDHCFKNIPEIMTVLAVLAYLPQARVVQRPVYSFISRLRCSVLVRQLQTDDEVIHLAQMHQIQWLQARKGP